MGPTLELLRTRLSALADQATTFRATVYRSSTPEYATEADLRTGEGSKHFGGRWNPAGIAVVYASLTPETAMAETLAQNRYYGIPIEDAMPRTFVGIAVRLKVVLDLRTGTIRQRLQVSEERILAVDWRKEMRARRTPITQLLGQAADEENYEGLIVPSAADPAGHNLLVFPGNLRRGSSLSVQHADKL